jgi:hypothetical protein
MCKEHKTQIKYNMNSSLLLSWQQNKRIIK